MSGSRSPFVRVARSALRAVLASPNGRGRTTPSRFRARLSLEALEDRTVPAAFSPTSFADDLNVNSLRAAVVAANGNGQDDVITLQAGVYNLSIAGVVENAAATGDLDVTEAGHLLTIQGAGVGETEIDANGLDRVLHVFPGVKLVLRDLTIRGGLAFDDGDAFDNARGGGILNNGGTVTLIGAAVDSNIAQGLVGATGVSGSSGGIGRSAFGGGVFTTGGVLTLKGSKVVHNQAVGGAGGAGAADTNAGANAGTVGNGGLGGAAFGGGICQELDDNTSTPEGVQLLVKGLTKSRVDDNQAVGGAGGAGGAGNNGTASGETNNGGDGGLAAGAGLVVRSGANTTISTALVRFNDARGGAGGPGGNAGALGVGGAGGRGGGCDGGGLQLGASTEPGSLTVMGITVTLNRATGGAGGRGGDGTSNTSASGGAGGGGGLVFGGAISLGLNLSMKKSVISQNLGQGGEGGAGGKGGTLSSSPGAGGSGGAGGGMEGGAVRIAGGTGSMSLLTTTVNNNQATGGNGGDGGDAGFLSVGSAGGIGGVGGRVQGGAVCVDNSAVLSLTRSTISRSTASGGSGGFGGIGQIPADGGNGGAGQGGGLFIDVNAHVTVTNATISTNTVQGGFGGVINGDGGVSQGGGIWVDGEDNDTRLDLFNSTVAGNTAIDSLGSPGQPGQGGGVFNTDSGADAADNTVTAVSTLFGDNTASTGPDFVGDVNANFSLFESTSTTNINVIPVAGVSADKNVKGKDPKLGPLQNNGGTTSTHALLAGSPAVNKGANPNNLTMDQRGFKPRDFGGKADIGAFEMGAS